MRRCAASAIAVVLLAGACVFGDSTAVTDAPPDSILPPPSETPVTVATPRGVRSYELVVPPDLGRDPAPLIVAFHECCQDPTEFAASTRFDELAKEEGFVVAYPRALDEVWDFEDRDHTDRPDVDDVAFVREMIDAISETVPIDRDRVYATGLLRGGGFAILLACRMPGQIAAVATVGPLFHHDGAACEDPQPARVLVIVGERSWAVVPGGIPPTDIPMADPPRRLDQEIADWVNTNRCRPIPEETMLPGDVQRSVYDCPNGAALDVYIHGGCCFWPKEDVWGIDATSTIWRFFERFDGPIAEGEGLSAAETSFIDTARIAVGPGVSLTSPDGSLSSLGETILDVGYWACTGPPAEFVRRFVGEVDTRGMSGDAPAGVLDAALEYLCR